MVPLGWRAPVLQVDKGPIAPSAQGLVGRAHGVEWWAQPGGGQWEHRGHGLRGRIVTEGRCTSCTGLVASPTVGPGEAARTGVPQFLPGELQRSDASGQKSSVTPGKSVAWDIPSAGLAAHTHQSGVGSSIASHSMQVASAIVGFPTSTGVAAHLAKAYVRSVNDTLKASIPALLTACRAAAEARFYADPRRAADVKGEFVPGSPLMRDIIRTMDDARNGMFSPMGGDTGTAGEVAASLPVMAQVGSLLYRLVEAMVASSPDVAMRSQTVLFQFREWMNGVRRNAYHSLPSEWSWEEGLAVLGQSFRAAEQQVAAEAKLIPKFVDKSGAAGNADMAKLIAGLTQAIKGGSKQQGKDTPAKSPSGGQGSQARTPKSQFAPVPNMEQQAAVEAVMPADPQARVRFMGSRVCWSWVDNGFCRWGDNCSFVHTWNLESLKQAGATVEEIAHAREVKRGSGAKRKANE